MCTSETCKLIFFFCFCLLIRVDITEEKGIQRGSLGEHSTKPTRKGWKRTKAEGREVERVEAVEEREDKKTLSQVNEPFLCTAAATADKKTMVAGNRRRVQTVKQKKKKKEAVFDIKDLKF